MGLSEVIRTAPAWAYIVHVPDEWQDVVEEMDKQGRDNLYRMKVDDYANFKNINQHKFRLTPKAQEALKSIKGNRDWSREFPQTNHFKHQDYK